MESLDSQRIEILRLVISTRGQSSAKDIVSEALIFEHYVMKGSLMSEQPLESQSTT